MNGGRLSDDEAMLQGLRQVRAALAGEAPAEPPHQALRMIAMRFPEEAENITALWMRAPSGHRQEIETLLAEIERQHAEDSAEDA
ncbi:MAG TPA: hypothetical protein VE996_04425 [Terriglobales bacterium]|nr:hypothetical protein [Terriglobales bacterium]